MGFLHEIRRSNVAITRARRHLALIGDSSTLSHEPFLKGMFDYCMKTGRCGVPSNTCLVSGTNLIGDSSSVMYEPFLVEHGMPDRG